MFARYAVYFSPRDQSALDQFGRAILGRRATEQRSASATSTFSDGRRWQALTQKPAHYGFHATLKAPFELARGCRADDLAMACQNLATEHSSILLDTLAPRRISHFAALTLGTHSDAVNQLADACVTALEPWRSPISEHDLQRRLNSNLTARQIEQLTTHGYPYIFDDFQFHMTLSDQLNDDKDYMQWLENEYTDLVRYDPVLDQIALFAQIDRDSAFVRIEEFRLA